MDKPTDKLLKSPPDNSFCIRCPRLGHQINFSYCNMENNGLPCFKTLDCWHHYFQVHAYLAQHLTRDDFNAAFSNTAKPKIVSLFDLIEQAKKAQDSED